MIRHFAYGSNLLPARLAARVPVIRDLGACRVPGFVLRFHKRGADGSGKADLTWTGRATDVVHGALLELTADAACRLDNWERGYRRHSVETDGAGPAFAYVADPALCDPGLLPFDWYLALILAGARIRGLPAGWLAGLAAQPVRIDSDHARASAARVLLGNGQGT